MRKGADAHPTLEALYAKVQELNDQILADGVTIVPILDRSDVTERLKSDTSTRNTVLAPYLHPYLLSLRSSATIVWTQPDLQRAYDGTVCCPCLSVKRVDPSKGAQPVSRNQRINIGRYCGGFVPPR
jgi:hypothetical protein